MYNWFGLPSTGQSAPELEVIHRPPKARRKRPWPLVFVHGAHAGAWCWNEHFLPWFAGKGYDCRAVSLRGHGGSRGRRSLQWHSLDDYVADLCRVIDELETTPVVIGHSMGGMVIQKYLERRSLIGAVLMASVPPSGLASSVLRMLASDPGLFAEISLMHGSQGRLTDMRSAGRAVFSDRLDPALLERYGARMQGESQRVLMDMTLWNLARPSLVKTCPMLVLSAGDDALFTEEMARETQRAYNADLVVVDGMAHAMMLEHDWLRAAEPIADWLEQLQHASI
ncbi:MAG: alpha/beta hydrolase [Ectothiorhodospiraceae bacterium]|nr:alpha/beta hydrolase [Ectothiorhodospiraceae bacterium]MCH8506743.1 alpha/beta hydrolase [Ectothiorhodospiraceae bacterium]